MALKSQHIVWELEWVWLHSSGRTIDSIARTWIGNAHSITIARELQSSLRSAHT